MGNQILDYFWFVALLSLASFICLWCKNPYLVSVGISLAVLSGIFAGKVLL